MGILLKVIRVSGEVELKSALDESQVGSKVQELIGADCCDLVNLRDGNFMYLDNEGYSKGLPVNAEATKLYHAVCKAGPTH